MINWIHDHGGVALGVHAKEQPTFMSMSYNQLEDIACLLDGMEVINGRDIQRGLGENYPMREMARKHQLAQIGGSDFHKLNDIGIVATKIFNGCENWQDVIEAIRNKQTEPFVRTVIPHQPREKNRVKRYIQQLLA